MIASSPSGETKQLTAAYVAKERIDARRKIVMPGLIDGHGHAGHGLLKTLGADSDDWYPATEVVYARGSSLDFWRAEAYLAGVERLKFGVTTALSFLGGGEMIMRTDDPAYGDAYMTAIDRVGLRFFLAVGPRRSPYPNTYVQWTGEQKTNVPVSFERHLEVSEALIKKWNGAGNGRLHVAMAFPTHHPETTPLGDSALAAAHGAGAGDTRRSRRSTACSSPRTATRAAPSSSPTTSSTSSAPMPCSRTPPG